MAFGLVVMLVNAYVSLPIVGEVFGGGDPIADVPSMAGWGTFSAEHVIYGLVLGLIVAAWPGTASARHHRDREPQTSVAP